MNRPDRRILVPLGIGLLSGLAALVAILLVGDTFGYPGSTAYRVYESFNRAMAVLITLQAGALIGFYFQHKDALGRYARFALSAASIAWIGMAGGTAAEFWMYSDLPYGTDNMRSAAFGLFSLSSLIAGLALMVLGGTIFVRRQLPRYFGLVLMLVLPLDIALFIAGQSIFLAPVLAAVSLSLMALRGGSAPAALSHEPV